VRFLIDAQLPPALAQWLRDQGYDALSVRDVGLREASDAMIWAYAAAEQLIVVSKDEDFALLAAKQRGPTVLWVRVGNLTKRSLVSRFAAVWPQIVDHLESGAAVVELR
jgi:predicted nuclease of predicted toxin-antitoxin system